MTKVVLVYKSGSDVVPFLVATCTSVGVDADGALVLQDEEGGVTEVKGYCWFEEHKSKDAVECAEAMMEDISDMLEH